MNCRKFPETARWLLANDRLEEAHAILMKCGPKKNQQLDPEELKELLASIRADEKLNIEENQAQTKTTPLDLLKTRKLRRWTIIVCWNW